MGAYTYKINLNSTRDRQNKHNIDTMQEVFTGKMVW